MKNRWWKRHKTRDSCNNIGDWAINQVALPESSAPQVMDIEKTMRTGWFTSDFFWGCPIFRAKKHVGMIPRLANSLSRYLRPVQACGSFAVTRRGVFHGRRSARELGISGGDEDVCPWKNQMQHTNPNAHTYVNGTDVETHGYAVSQNTFMQ
jgi:hypothetical protein